MQSAETKNTDITRIRMLAVLAEADREKKR